MCGEYGISTSDNFFMALGTSRVQKQPDLIVYRSALDDSPLVLLFEPLAGFFGIFSAFSESLFWSFRFVPEIPLARGSRAPGPVENPWSHG